MPRMLTKRHRDHVARNRFSQTHPGDLRHYNKMKVEIVTEGRLIDIIKDGFDSLQESTATPQCTLREDIKALCGRACVGERTTHSRQKSLNRIGDSSV
jgi:hypothetical protein